MKNDKANSQPQEQAEVLEPIPLADARLLKANVTATLREAKHDVATCKAAFMPAETYAALGKNKEARELEYRRLLFADKAFQDVTQRVLRLERALDGLQAVIDSLIDSRTDSRNRTYKVLAHFLEQEAGFNIDMIRHAPSQAASAMARRTLVAMGGLLAEAMVEGPVFDVRVLVEAAKLKTTSAASSDLHPGEEGWPIEEEAPPPLAEEPPPIVDGGYMQPDEEMPF